MLIHTHPRSVVTLSSFRILPEIYDQESCFLAGDIAIYDEDYEGLAGTEDRIGPMAEVLRKARNLIMPNHGALTSGDNLAGATVRMILMENIARRYLEVSQTKATLGKTPQAISSDVAIQTRKELEGLKAEGLVWQDYIKRLGFDQPDGFR